MGAHVPRLARNTCNVSGRIRFSLFPLTEMVNPIPQTENERKSE